MKKAFSFILTIIFLLSSSVAFAWSDWLTLKTEHFTVFYHSGREAEARQVLETLEYYRPQVEKLCGNQVWHFPVVIDDTGMLVNGFSNPANFNMHLFRQIPGAWAGTENWWSLVGVHELTHQLSLSKTGGAVEVLGNIFGDSFFMPNLYTPGWIIEGITVYSESQHSQYQGRLNDGLFDAYIGARAAEDRFPSILEATYSPFGYPGGSGIYNYGGEFFKYLADRYGEEKFARFFEANGSSVLGLIPLFPSFGIDRSARNVFDKSFPQLWMEWQDFEKSRSKDFQMAGEQITDQGWVIDSLKVNDNKLYYQRNYSVKTNAFSGFNFAEIVERNLSNGEERILASTTGGFAKPFKLNNNLLSYLVYEQKAGYANASERSYGLYTVLHQKDLLSGKDRTLLKTELRAFEVLENGNIIYTVDRKNGFGSEVFTLDPATRTSRSLFQTDFLIEEITASGDKIVVTARKDWETFSLYLLNLETRELTPLVNTPFEETGIAIQGDRLFFNANYEKKISAYCYDFRDVKIYRLTETGYVAYPAFDQSNNLLYYIGLNSKGNDIYRQNATFTEYQPPQCPATIAPTLNMPDLKVTKGNYFDNLKTLKPSYWMPLIDSETEKYGFYFGGGDAIMDFPYYVAAIGYDFKKDKYFGSLDLEVDYLAPFQLTVSYDDHTFNDEKTASLSMTYPVISRLAPGIAGLFIGTSLNYDPDYDGLEIEPFVTTKFRSTKSEATLHVSFPHSRLKSGGERAGLYTGLTLRQYLPESELLLKVDSINDPDNPDNVFTEIRGYDQESTARKGEIYTLEFSKPIWRIHKGLWNPNVYLEDMVVTLFADEVAPEAAKRQSSQGFELHFETKTMYALSIDWGYRFTLTGDDDQVHEIFIKSVIPGI